MRTSIIIPFTERSKSMPNKPSEEEEKHFQQEHQRLMADLKGEEQASKEERETWGAIALAVGSNKLAIGHKLATLGFNAETAAILFFSPLVEVAWADGKVGYEESYKIVDEVRSRGIRATSAAYEFLSQMTLERPKPEWFHGCNEVIRALLQDMSGSERDKNISSLTALCAEVANASRGFFGFGPKVSPEEKNVIKDIISELGLEESNKAKDILKKLSR